MRYILLLILLLISINVSSQVLYQGYCEDGGKTVTTTGVPSTTKVQQSFPSCTVTVYLTGTTTIAPITTNGITVKTNSFTAATNGYWSFYAIPNLIDVRFSNGGITTPYTHTYASGGSGGGGGGGTGNNPSAGGIGTVANFQLPVSATVGKQYDVGDAIPGSSPCVQDGFTNQGAIATWNGTQWVCAAVASTQNLDTTANSFFSIYLAGGNVTTSTFLNPLQGKLITVQVKQDSTGARTFAWPSNVINAPAISATARTSTTASFYYDGTNWQYISTPQLSANLVSAASVGNKIIIANAFPSTFGDEGSRIVNADMACGTLPCIIYHFGGGKITQEVVVRSNHKLILSGGTYTTLSANVGTAITGAGDIPNPWFVNVISGVEQPTGVPFTLQDNSTLECTGWDTQIQENTISGLWQLVTPFNAAKFGNSFQSTNIKVSGCHFIQGAPAFASANPIIGLGNCRGCSIDHNYFDTLSSISANLGGDSSTGNFAQDSWITDNLFVHTPTQNIAVVNGDDIHIQRNIIRDPARQSCVSQPGSSPIDIETNIFTDHGSNISVEGNIIDNSTNLCNSVNQAININCGGSHCQNVNITGNTIQGGAFPVSGVLTGGGIRVFSATAVNVTNNALLQASAGGISFNQTTSGTIGNNRLIYSPGIGLTDSVHIFVNGNVTEYPALTTGAAIVETGSSDFNSFTNNVGFAQAPGLVGANSFAVNNYDPSCNSFPTCGSGNTGWNVTRNTVMLQTDAGFAVLPISVTTTYAATNTAGVLHADSTGGAFTITLPAKNLVLPGRLYTIKVIAGAALVTVNCNASNGAQTIDGAATYVGLTTANKYVVLQYGIQGSGKWYIIGSN